MAISCVIFYYIRIFEIFKLVYYKNYAYEMSH